MTTLTQDLIQLLTVVPKDQGYFLAQSKPLFGDHIFGGQLLAQSIISASYTCTLPLHSLHANFISAGHANQPVLFKVENLRDSHSFSTRQVTAIQHGKPIYGDVVLYE
ncbi:MULTISPECIES: acyl-CoA thioesterase II [unclassified Acinetobacter]|uniref:acyl-CoA thioesterase n=1 Tax=unclassified Acinetobacter TaxID=196816 RepID=UPI0015D0FA0E|nr:MULTISPECIES: acyl-CoA thioesterase domain-containing protein [unclassified Acinetobacter]